MRLQIKAWDVVALEQGIEEHLGTFSSHRRAIAYGEYLITTGQISCWANKSRDGVAVSGPYKLQINPKFGEEPT